MKIVTYSLCGVERLGFLVGDHVLDAEHGYRQAGEQCGGALGYLPNNILDFLRLGEPAFADARTLCDFAVNNIGSFSAPALHKAGDVTLLAPVPRPTSMRDGYAFRQHVEAARRNRGVDMIPEFDEIPIFYFTNHLAVFGGGDLDVLPMHLGKLDFELEVAIVIGREGRNIPAERADEYIAGYMVMNDWSAREMQMHEMKLNLGPAKGKDFATSIGPWLVTKDELADKRIPGEKGERYDLEMKAVVNGQQVSLGNVKDMTWTFAQIIERASYGVTLHPGDVIGSGTCGTGCFLELNGSKVFPEPWWLKDGDTVELSVERLGTLENKVRLVS